MKSLQNSILRGWRLVFLLYILLLLLSSLFELRTSTDKRALTDVGNLSNDLPTILSFPDLEGDNEKLDSLLNSLKENFRILEIDYNELNFSESNYSAKKYAELIEKNLNPDSINRLSIIASGFGSVIASEFIHISNTKIESFVLLDAEGILEFELLGGYHLNKGVYSVNSVFSWTLENLLPDFGYFEHSSLSYQNSRTRLDTDLRKSKANFRAVRVPTLIIDTSEKYTTEAASAKEFHRLMVSSRIAENDDALNVVNVSLTVQNFISEGSSNAGDISVSKKIKSKLPFSNSKVISAEGWLLTGLMLLIIFSTFFSEDLACIGAGLMAARGLMGFFPAVAASFIGIFVGDILIYLSGRWLGKSATKKAPFKWFITDADIERSNEWFQAKGPMIILISRFIPGTRFPTYFSAGVIGASFLMFISYFGIASLIWTPILVSAAMVLGQKLIYYFSIYQEYALLVLGAAVILALLVLKVVIPLFTYRGRRLLYGKYQRLIRWEFWSPFILYSPVVFYVFFLWIRFKKITVVTAANPGMEEGGFIGESKSNILGAIKNREFIADYCFLDHSKEHSEILDIAISFMNENSLDFPIVLKPDEGERGKGVQIVKSKEELINKISLIDEGFILQEFIAGKEFGIFYYRYPDQEKGIVFSITKKEKIFITGDGNHTLEQLILEDSRAVCMAETHFEKHAHKLYGIPEKGERIQLVELGTHSKGSLFLDGKELISKDLTESMDEISLSFDGFYFGRYDIIAPSEEHLRKGQNLKVLEVNGVTSEATNIYDPEHSFFFAVKTLMRQWRIAYEIGAINHKKGVEIPTLKYMWRLIFHS